MHERPWFDPWVRKILWSTDRLPTPVFWPGEFLGQKSLAGLVHGVAKSRTRLSNFTFTFQLVTLGVPPPQSYVDKGREVGQVIEGALHLLSFLCVIPGAWPTLRDGLAHWDS